MVLVYLMTVTIEAMRIYMGYILNLSPKGPRSKLVYVLALGACLPMMCVSWYLYEDHGLWMRVIYNSWTAFIVLEMIGSVFVIWKRIKTVSRFPNWEALEANQRAQRRRCCASSRVYKL